MFQVKVGIVAEVAGTNDGGSSQQQEQPAASRPPPRQTPAAACLQDATSVSTCGLNSTRRTA